MNFNKEFQWYLWHVICFHAQWQVRNLSEPNEKQEGTRYESYLISASKILLICIYKCAHTHTHWHTHTRTDTHTCTHTHTHSHTYTHTHTMHTHVYTPTHTHAHAHTHTHKHMHTHTHMHAYTQAVTMRSCRSVAIPQGSSTAKRTRCRC